MVRITWMIRIATFLFAWLLVLTAFGQAGYQRNFWTTNTLATSSNVTAYVTNHCSITGENTNRVIVAGAGTSAANGTYVFKATVGNQNVYTNLNQYGLIDDPAELTGDTYYITNTAGTAMYGHAVPGVLETTWEVRSGTAPAPTVLYEDVTNCQAFLIVNGIRTSLPQFATNILYLNPQLGLPDQHALRGRPDRPWATLKAVITAASNANDIVIMNAGVHAGPGTDTIAIGQGVKILGAGFGATIITNQGNWTFNVPANVTLAGFTMYSNACVLQPGASNVLFHSVEGFGAADNILMDDGWKSCEVWHCKFSTFFDGINDRSTNSGGVCRIFFTDIVANDKQAFGIVQAVAVSSNTIYVTGGSLTASNGSGINAPVAFIGAASGPGRIILNNVALIHSNTNGPTSAITNYVANNGTLTGNWTDNGTNAGTHYAVGQSGIPGGSSPPVITSGSGAPSAALPNGSIYLRTDGSWWLRTNNAWIIK